MQDKIDDVVYDFLENLFDSKYYRKPLKNVWPNTHELQIGWDIRILVAIIIIDDIIEFLNIWTHSSLELSSNKKLKI